MDNVDQEDGLDRQLREAASYIDDDGFTARILQQLPEARPKRRPRRAVIMIGISILASVLAYFISDGGRFINESINQLAKLPTLWLLLLTFAIGLLVSAIGFVAAMSKSNELAS
jgi:hypothetical protein